MSKMKTIYGFEIPISSDSGGVENWELISDITLTEDVGIITINKDMNGKPFALKKVYAELTELVVGEKATWLRWLSGSDAWGYSVGKYSIGSKVGTDWKTNPYFCMEINEHYTTAKAGNFTLQLGEWTAPTSKFTIGDQIFDLSNGLTDLRFCWHNMQYPLLAGTRLRMYGIRM